MEKQEISERLMSMGESLIEYLKEGMTAGKEFVMEQAPLVVQELIAYNRAYYTFLTALGAVMLLAGIILFLKAKKQNLTVCKLNEGSCEKHCKAETFECPWPYLIMGGLHVFVGSIIFFANVADCLKVWFAPRVFLIEYLVQLFKTASS